MGPYKLIIQTYHINLQYKLTIQTYNCNVLTNLSYKLNIFTQTTTLTSRPKLLFSLFSNPSKYLSTQPFSTSYIFTLFLFSNIRYIYVFSRYLPSFRFKKNN